MSTMAGPVILFLMYSVTMSAFLWDIHEQAELQRAQLAAINGRLFDRLQLLELNG